MKRSAHPRMLALALFAGLAMSAHGQPDSVSDSTQQLDPSEYEALIQELYGGEDQTQTAKPVQGTDQQKTGRVHYKREERGIMKRGSVLHGAGLSFEITSPFVVASSLSSWYSFVDLGVNLRLPYRTEVEEIPLYFDLGMRAFNFENTFPEKGTFTGLAYMAQVTAEGTRWGALLGFGVWNGALGGKLGAERTLWLGKSLFLRLGTQGVLVTEAESLGSIWWLDWRASLGLGL